MANDSESPAAFAPGESHMMCSDETFQNRLCTADPGPTIAPGPLAAQQQCMEGGIEPLVSQDRGVGRGE